MNRLQHLVSKPGPVIWAVLYVVIATAAIYFGIQFRQWFYPATADYHFPYDISNAWDQGSAIYVDAVLLQNDGKQPRWSTFLKCYLNRYDKIISQHPDGEYRLDYPPGRLLIMALWAKSERANYIPFFSNPSSEQFARPLLWIDTTAELAGAILTFFVVRLVLVRDHDAWANVLALLSAILLWFNPTVLMDRVWPQWDSWVLPFYLLAAFFALNRWWLWAGVCIGVGMMFKGQVVCTSAVFVLWPLFQWRLRAVLEVIVGAFWGLSVCISPWLIRTPMAIGLLVTVSIVVGVGARYIPRRWRVLVIAASVPMALFASGIFFGGSFAWWLVPFAYSSHHFMELGVGTPTNLAKLLSERWNWELTDILYSSDRFSITIRAGLVTLYGLTLTACAYGLARHDARNSRRALLALATPWLLMFAFMPQMHERYLYWGAALTAMAAGVSLGMTLLHLAISLLACVAMANWLFKYGSDTFARIMHGMFPDSAWAVILITLIFLYFSIMPDGKKPPMEKSAPLPDNL